MPEYRYWWSSPSLATRLSRPMPWYWRSVLAAPMPNTWVTQAPSTPPCLARKQSHLSPWPQALSVALPDTVSEIQLTVTVWVGGPGGSQDFATGLVPVVGLFRLSVGGGGALGSQSGCASVGWNGSLLPVAGPGGFASTGAATRTVPNATVSSENRMRRWWVRIAAE